MKEGKNICATNDPNSRRTGPQSKNIDINVPLNKIVGIAGVSSSANLLLRSVFYMRRAPDVIWALSAHTRRRMTQAAKQTSMILYIPAGIGLHQRPSVPGIHQYLWDRNRTLNSLRLCFPDWQATDAQTVITFLRHWLSLPEQPLYCPDAAPRFYAPSAEELAF